jgi:hypothetical protein
MTMPIRIRIGYILASIGILSVLLNIIFILVHVLVRLVTVILFKIIVTNNDTPVLFAYVVTFTAAIIISNALIRILWPAIITRSQVPEQRSLAKISHNLILWGALDCILIALLNVLSSTVPLTFTYPWLFIGTLLVPCGGIVLVGSFSQEEERNLIPSQAKKDSSRLIRITATLVIATVVASIVAVRLWTFSQLPWQELQIPFQSTAASFISSSVNKDVAYICSITQRQIWQTLDGAHTWKQIALPSQIDAISHCDLDPNNDRHLVVMGYSHPNFEGRVSIFTVDGGQTWGISPDGEIIDSFISYRNIWYMIREQIPSGKRYLVISHDQGTTWIKNSLAISMYDDVTLSLFPELWIDPETGFLLAYGDLDTSGNLDASRHSYFQSTDQGQTWSIFRPDNGMTPIAVRALGSGQWAICTYLQDHGEFFEKRINHLSCTQRSGNEWRAAPTTINPEIDTGGILDDRGRYVMIGRQDSLFEGAEGCLMRFDPETKSWATIVSIIPSNGVLSFGPHTLWVFSSAKLYRMSYE